MKNTKQQKILLIRFSSIGDIVLTTPVIRCLKMQLPHVEIHYLTKKQFASILQSNPYIDQLHFLDNNLWEVIQILKNEQFNYIIDLHNNQRTWLIKTALWHVQSYSFHKINVAKWLKVNWKWNLLPNTHIVDRYLQTVAQLGIKNDGRGLDYFIPRSQQINILQRFPNLKQQNFIALVIGAKHFTKRLPKHKLLIICELIEKPIILLGGKAEAATANWIVEKLAGTKHIINASGELSLHESASVLAQAEKVITPDTGLMHIAAALNKPILSIWGSTIPEFGMYPYQTNHKILEIKDLTCRPCTKIGRKQCPKKHFHCMELIDENEVADWANINTKI